MTQFQRNTRIAAPLWVKLGLAFMLVFAIPSIIGGSLLISTAREVDQESIGAYIQQNGQRQRQVVTSYFQRASEQLTQFANSNDRSNHLIVGLLLSDKIIDPPIPTASQEEIELVLAETLLNPAEALFRNVIILDSEGIIVASEGRGEQELLPGEADIGQDNSNSTVYRQMIAELETNPDTEQIIVTQDNDTRPIQMINRVNLHTTDNIIGYVVATLDVQNTLNSFLTFNDDVYPAYSFLISRNGAIITPDIYTEKAESARDSTAVDRAFDLQTGFDFVRQQNGTGEEVGSYFAPIGDDFALITQVSTLDILAERQKYFSALLFPVLVGIVVLGLVLTLFNRHLTEPLENLQQAMQSFSVGVFDTPVTAADRGDEIGNVARSFLDMRQQTRNLIEDLERRIDRRTRDMETTQEISHFATTQRDLQTLIDDVVELIVKRFGNIYHAQIFLIDKDERFVVLRASTGAPGRELLSRGHRLAVGSASVVGQAAAQNTVVVARDTANSEVHSPNPHLKDTNSELALPLHLGDRVIGVLDVQSKESATFDREQINVLDSMADQLAIAIENTRLYQESLQRLRSLQIQRRDETKRAWQEYMYDNRLQGIVHQAGTPTDTDFDALRQRAIDTNAPAMGQRTERETIPIAVPLRLRGDVIGAIVYELPSTTYAPDNIQLAQELAERLSLSLDNTRLFEQSRRATERERLVNDISAKLTTQTDINHILQTAVREVGQALRAPQVSIRLNQGIYRPAAETDRDDTTRPDGN